MVSLNRRSPSKAAKTVTTPPALAGRTVELEISLRHIKPRIWRRFVVPGDIGLHPLHDVIQTVMGWTDTHLHSYRKGRHEYVQRDPNDPDWDRTLSDTEIHDERQHRLGDLVGAKGDSFTYTYDFGDDWDHDITVKAIRPSPQPLEFATCVAGARACPPEDCGGPYGFMGMCAALSDPQDPEHEHWKEWIEEFDPAAFDRDEVNRALSRLRLA